MPTEAQIEAAARRMWRDEHGYITSHDSVCTPESVEAELDRTGYGVWDGTRISGVVKEAFRRRAEAALRAAEEVGPWEYGVVAAAFGGDPEPYPTLEAAEHVRDNTASSEYRRWTHGSAVTIFRRRPAGEWQEFSGE